MSDTHCVFGIPLSMNGVKLGMAALVLLRQRQYHLAVS